MKVLLDRPIPKEEILRATGAFGTLPDGYCARAIVTHSSEAEAGDLYFALRGERFCGADFVPDVLSRGAVAVTDVYRPGVLLVKDAGKAFLDLASHYLETLPKRKLTVAVTGSVGKTTVKDLLSLLLSCEYETHATAGNFNNRVGVPLTVFSSPLDTEALVIETGMNHRGEIGELSCAVRPTDAVITGVGHAHIGNLGSLADVAKEKRSVTLGMAGGRVTLPASDASLLSIEGARTVAFPGDGAGDFSVRDLRMTDAGSRFVFTFDETSLAVSLKTPGVGAVRCAALALATAVGCGLSEDALHTGIEKLAKLPSRRKSEKIGTLTVIDDAYNASPESVRAAAEALCLSHGERLAVLLGDMAELGTYTQSLHEEAGEYFATLGLSSLYLFGTYAPFTARGAMHGGMSCDRIFVNNDLTDPETTARQIRGRSPSDGVLLMKASRCVKLERVADCLRGMEGEIHA